MEYSLDYSEHLCGHHSPAGGEQCPKCNMDDHTMHYYQASAMQYIQNGHVCLPGAVQCFLFQDPYSSQTACFDEKIISE